MLKNVVEDIVDSMVDRQVDPLCLTTGNSRCLVNTLKTA